MSRSVLNIVLFAAADIVDHIMSGSSQWSELFSKHDFFHKYRYYLQVIASSGDADIQLKWCVTSLVQFISSPITVHRAGTVESRIRQLVMKLEFVEALQITHPFTKGFDQVFYCAAEEEVNQVVQGEVSEVVAQRKATDNENLRPIYTATFYIGLGLQPKQRASGTTARP